MARVPPGKRVSTLIAVSEERQRQDALVATRKMAFNCSDPAILNADKLPILAEEFGEVARAMQDDLPNLRTELIHVAAVAVAWAESLTPREGLVGS